MLFKLIISFSILLILHECVFKERRIIMVFDQSGFELNQTRFYQQDTLKRNEKMTGKESLNQVKVSTKGQGNQIWINGKKWSHRDSTLFTSKDSAGNSISILQKGNGNKAGVNQSSNNAQKDN